ncbi:MAG: response regulator [Methylococcales bacterium]|nr:response regulator [Methylococcaceae bacterium]
MLNLSPQKILIVEDQAVMRETLKHILYGMNAKQIIEAENGNNAIAAMIKTRFDIVLCDYNLGAGKNGQQVLEEARHLKLLPFSALFLLVTSEQNPAMVLSAVGNKPDDYLIKPFNGQQLLNRLERCFIRKSALADVESELDKGNLYQAITNCETLLAQHDKKIRMQLLKIRAELALKISDFKTAKAVYLDVLLERDLPWARLGLAIVAYSEGDYFDAIESLHELTEQFPMLLEAYDWLAKAYEATKNVDGAISAITQAIELSPHTILRQQQLALLADSVNSLDLANKAYKAAIKLGRNSVHKSSSDFSGLAKNLLKTKANSTVLNLVSELLEQFPDDPEARLRAAALETEIYRTLGKNELAQKSYEKTVKLNKQFGSEASRELRLEIAQTCFQRGNTEIFDQIMQELIKTNIDDKKFLESITRICTEMMNENYAESLIHRVKQELVDINNRGVSLFKEGKIKEALAVFEQAISNLPNNQTIVLNISKIMVHDLKTSGGDSEKIQKAQAYINKAIQLGIPHDKIGGLQAELARITHHQHHSR